jgi:hypothetical protein
MAGFFGLLVMTAFTLCWEDYHPAGSLSPPALRNSSPLPFPSPPVFLNDLHTFDPDGLTWTHLSPFALGTAPAPRYSRAWRTRAQPSLLSGERVNVLISFLFH